jgi:hypothetical protein
MLKSALLTNWKTTLGGAVAGVMLVLGQAQHVLDEDVVTQIDWNVIAAGVGIIWAAVMARDSDVSSERAKAS